LTAHIARPSDAIDTRQNGTYALVALDTQIAGYGASNIAPKAAVMCGRTASIAIASVVPGWL
jgi:hypothetical protein